MVFTIGSLEVFKELVGGADYFTTMVEFCDSLNCDFVFVIVFVRVVFDFLAIYKIGFRDRSDIT